MKAEREEETVDARGRPLPSTSTLRLAFIGGGMLVLVLFVAWLLFGRGPEPRPDPTLRGEPVVGTWRVTEATAGCPGQEVVVPSEPFMAIHRGAPPVVGPIAYPCPTELACSQRLANPRLGTGASGIPLELLLADGAGASCATPAPEEVDWRPSLALPLPMQAEGDDAPLVADRGQVRPTRTGCLLFRFAATLDRGEGGELRYTRAIHHERTPGPCDDAARARADTLDACVAARRYTLAPR